MVINIDSETKSDRFEDGANDVSDVTWTPEYSAPNLLQCKQGSLRNRRLPPSALTKRCWIGAIAMMMAWTVHSYPFLTSLFAECPFRLVYL